VEPILYRNPLQLFQGMWGSGLFVNCNVYHGCSTGCRYCYVALNRKCEQLRRPALDVNDPFDGAKRFASTLNKVFGPRYDETDFLQFCLHERLPVTMSNNSDPLSDLEAEHGCTLDYLHTLADLGFPLQVLTKLGGWGKIDRDKYIEAFKRFRGRMWLAVTFSCTEEAQKRDWEPNAPSPAELKQFIGELTAEGIDVAVHMVPMIPDDSFPNGPWDEAETYRPFLEELKALGVFGVTCAPLSFDKRDGDVLTDREWRWVRDHEWCNVTAERAWKAYHTDASIMLHISTIWRDLCQDGGLTFAPYQYFGSLLGAEQVFIPTPTWHERQGCWYDVVKMLTAEREPIITTTRDVALMQARGLRWKEHVFASKSIAPVIPYSIKTTEQDLVLELLPKHIRAADIMHLELEHLGKVSDTAWIDRAMSPVTCGPGLQAIDKNGNYYMAFNVGNIRPSYAVSLSGYGWDGVPWETAQQYADVIAKEREHDGSLA
jgi:DNA repair photolyase